MSCFRIRCSASRRAGRLISLPRGATPIDFAYAVHTDVGDTCVGARVNGRHVPLATALKNGDSVEIIRSPKQGPSAAWEQMNVTGKARAAIRRYLRNAEKLEHQRMGRAIPEKAFRDAGHEFSEKALSAALKKLKLVKAEEIYALIGQGVVTPIEVMKSIFPGLKVDDAALGWANWQTKRPKGEAIAIQGRCLGLPTSWRLLHAVGGRPHHRCDHAGSGRWYTRPTVSVWKTCRTSRSAGLI